NAESFWSDSASELMAGGAALSPQAAVSLEADSHTLLIAGDASPFGDQFASAPLVVKPHTDYVLTLRIQSEQGPMAAKVTSADRRIALASAPIDGARVKRDLKQGAKGGRLTSAPDESVAQGGMSVMQMLFASGDRSSVCLVISNNGQTSSPHVARVGQANLNELGATPYRWTRYPRSVVRGIQKTLFKTMVMLPLVIAGVM